MFKPIIHNLQETDHAFAACQHYNRLIGKKPKINGTLEQKLEAIEHWKTACRNALDEDLFKAARNVVKQAREALYEI